MVTFGSLDRQNSKFLGEQLLELELKGEKTLGCGGGTMGVHKEPALSPTDSGRPAAGYGAKNDMTRVVF